jgi:hypothetical protein
VKVAEPSESSTRAAWTRSARMIPSVSLGGRPPTA